MTLNTLFNNSYRGIAVTFLIAVFVIAFFYAFLVVFYALNTSWGAPIQLSPSQSRVMSFQPQVATLVLNLNKQKTEVQNALHIKKNILEQLIAIDTLAIKIEKAAVVEKKRAQHTSASIDSLVTNKNKNIVESRKTLDTINQLTSQIDAELAAGLITSDQAATRKMSAQSANNSYTDLNITSTQMSTQVTQLQDFAATLGGSNLSLSALMPAKQLMELNALKSQLNLQLGINERNLDIVKKAMSADNRILQVAMDSPFYRALWAPTPVLFIPYDNLGNVKPGQPIYNCWLQVIFCSQVGTIDKLFDAEEYAQHPLFKTNLRGKFAAIILTDKIAINSSVLFLGSKPLFI